MMGHDGSIYLKNVYSRLSKYCLVFVSEDYDKSEWTRLEQETIQARELRGERGVLIPILTENYKPTWLLETRIYFDLSSRSIDDLIKMLKKMCLLKTDLSKEEYLFLYIMWNNFEYGDLAKVYDFDTTLKLINSCSPPFIWLESSDAKEVDLNSKEYEKIDIIFKNIAKGKINEQCVFKFNSISNFFPGLPAELEFPNHFDALFYFAAEGDLNIRDLQYYFYKNKLVKDTKFETILISFLIIFVITFIMKRFGGLSHSDRHNLILDELISQNTL